MNIILDELPKAITVDGAAIPIRTDFKVWIRVLLLLESVKNDINVIADIYSLIFFNVPKAPIPETLKAIIDFVNPNPKDYKPEQEDDTQTQRSRAIYSFAQDADLIYSAFWVQYGIDLRNSDMHWYEFKILFDRLTEGTEFYKVLEYRSVNLAEVKDKEKRKFYKKMKAIYALPDNRTAEEKENDTNAVLSGVFEI